jgi:GxxExxY protein
MKIESGRAPFDPDRVGAVDLDPKLNALSNVVIGAAIEVHRHLGPGYLESVYRRALCLELADRGVNCTVEAPFVVLYKSRPVGEGRFDILVEKELVVELKAVERLAPIHAAQLRSYLKASGLRLGLLINFNVLLLKDGIDRVIL